jgi:hypothetical protein
VPISIIFQYFSNILNNEVYGAYLVGILCFIFALYGNFKIRDGFHNNLDFNH